MKNNEEIALYNIEVIKNGKPEATYIEKPLEEASRLIKENPDCDLVHAVYVKKLVKSKGNRNV